jgi:hypothetical protein
MLQNLGKFKMGKACIYVNKLGDINVDVLKNLMANTIAWIEKTYPTV